MPFPRTTLAATCLGALLATAPAFCTAAEQATGQTGTAETGSAQTAQPQNGTRAERLAVARDYVAATMKDLDMKGFIRQMWQPLVDQMKTNGRPLTNAQVASLAKVYEDTLTQPLRDVMKSQDENLADLMTLDELRALRDFYTSEHGHAVMRKMPQLAALQQPMITQVIRSKMPEMEPKLRDIINGG